MSTSHRIEHRMQMLDCARFVAAVAVVASHIISEFFPQDPAAIVGTFGVPFYLFVALYFSMRGFVKQPDRSVTAYILGRVRRLYLPFLAWNVIYDLMHRAKHGGLATSPTATLLWAGSYEHLYFLPLLLILTVVLALIARPLVRYAWLRYSVAATAIVGGIILGWLGPLNYLHDLGQTDREALYQMHRSLASALFAIAFAAIAAVRPKRVAVAPAAGMFGVVATVVLIAIEYNTGQHQLLRALSGFGLVLAALTTVRSRWLGVIAWAGQLSYGVYLSHIAFLRVGVAIIDHYQSGFTVLNAILIGIFALTGSLALSAILARFKLTQWIVGYEGSPPRLTPTRPATLGREAPAAVAVPSPELELALAVGDSGLTSDQS